jgi:hypothetical protein
MEKKKLIINSAVCDARNVSESTLEAYESIVINAASILVTRETNELMSRYNVSMNAADVTEVPADAELMIENGNYEITGSTVISRPAVLIVNGKLDIGKGSQEALKKFLSITVNGSVSFPSDMKEQLPELNVNGSTDCYPGDAIRLQSNLVVDRTFIIRAKKAKYYVKNKVVIADGNLDISKLVEKGAAFITKQAIIAEGLLEGALPLFSEEVDIKTIPDGFTYVSDAVLSDALVQKNGDKLFVDGDLTINNESESALDKLSSLKINGKVLIVKKFVDKFQSLNADYNEIRTIKGKVLEDKVNVRIDKRMVTIQQDGITVTDCGMVNLNEDIPPEEIEEKLEFIDCGCIFCYPDQRSAVELVSEDVGRIDDSGRMGLSGMKEMAEGLHLFDKDTKVVNTVKYKM